MDLSGCRTEPFKYKWPRGVWTRNLPPRLLRRRDRTEVPVETDSSNRFRSNNGSTDPYEFYSRFENFNPSKNDFLYDYTGVKPTVLLSVVVLYTAERFYNRSTVRSCIHRLFLSIGPGDSVRRRSRACRTCPHTCCRRPL